ncbi:hypothetical protein PLICRDRAFT_181225 [Plicaturopsis crispa FD-325 SS-3]|uniref:Uncharacterized protein n=1 Tax=Plicaturopsis crispa FD-325 SS-3 TaxID=944288 RepID=A0A0C9T0K4_PLICR|nr:hypothetical protein PLICRDRAFT_181225 [Plicaturopsis crispa FD-325 SS-3]
MSHIRPLSNPRLSPAETDCRTVSTSDAIEFSTFGPISHSSAYSTSSNSTSSSSSPSLARRLVKFISPAAPIIVPILRVVMMKPTPLPTFRTDARPSLSDRIRSILSRGVKRHSTSSSETLSTTSRENPSLWSHPFTKPLVIWISHFVTTSSSPGHDNCRYVSTFKVVEKINERYMMLCGAEVYGQKIGVGDRVEGLSHRVKTPGRIRRVYRYTRDHIIYVWRVEKLGGSFIVDILLAVPIHDCRLSILDRIVYRLGLWALPTQTFTFAPPGYQLTPHNSRA